MSEQWYLSRNGQRHGPYTTEQFQQMISARQVVPTDLLWKAGMTGWAQASTIPGLFAADPLDVERTRRGSMPPPIPPPVNLDVESTVPRDRPAPKPVALVSLDVESTIPRSRSSSPSATPAPSTQQTPTAKPPLAPGAELKVGDAIDKFLITKTLGRGSMGIVYKATEQETEVDYAIKVLAPELVADPNALADLKKEVAVAQTLTHQNLLKVNYLAAAGSLTYVVMEYIDGENLEEYRLRKGCKLSPDQFRKIAPQVLGGLEYLHEKGVVHLDIKPHNIMLTKTGEVKITDYGIARTIKDQLYRERNTETPTGSLVYMAPEQLRGNNVLNRRTDVYAIGILFHRLLTGRFPFDERNREAIVRWHLDEKHQIAKLDHPGLQRVIQRAVAASSDERHASCKEMYRALADAGVLDIDQEDGTPAKPMQNTEAALALTRMIRHFINQDPLKVFFGWEGHYGKVIQQSPDQYELPPTDIAGRRAAVGKTFVPAIMTLSKILSEARTNNERVDSRINENLHVIVTEAEQVIERGIPQTIKLSVGGTALGFLLIVILFFAGGDGLKLGIASLGGVPLLALGIFIGGLLAGHVKRRQFCQDVLRFFGSETKMARFN